MRTMFVLAFAASLMGCATGPYGGAKLVEAPVSVQAPRGFELGKPDLLAGPDGVRVHGALCRKIAWGLAPTRLRLELLTSAGDPVAEVSKSIWGLMPHRRGCGFYNLPTNWRIEPGQTLRLTAE